MDLYSLISPLFTVIIPFLFVLTVVVFFHELGHFLVARYYGVKVTDFSIGFGNEIWGFNDKYGTRWRFAWIPLGGYVKFIDDENAASVPDKEALGNMSEADREGSFQEKPLAHRAAVVAAGPIANFILSIVIFAGIFSIYGERLTAARVDGVVENSAAAKAGFKTGDLILKIDGSDIESFNDMQRIVSSSAEIPLKILVERAATQVMLTAIPERKEITDRFGNKMKIGILGLRRNANSDEIVTKTYNPVSALWKGVEETYFIVERTLSYLGGIIVGRESADQLGGPIKIAQVSGQAASVGIMPLINLIAILSVSIGLINLFPIPMLDGGHLLFYGIEAVKGTPVDDKIRDYSFRIGMALVLMLMIFATMNDLISIKLL